MVMREAAPARRRAAIYARISEDRHADELGVKRQLRDCQELASARGFDIVGEYADNDLSASSGRRRPEYGRLLGDVKAGRVDVVLAWHADRLYRRMADLEAFIETVEAAGASVATVQAGEMDLATAAGRMVARMLGVVARHETELKGERQKRKARELAEAGKPTGGGHRPFGFEEDRVTIRESEAAEIRASTDRLLAGGSLRSIVSGWNARGITTTTGGAWRLTTARRLFTSARIAGLREHRGVIVGPATWPGIVSERAHEQLVALLTDPARRTTSSNARSYLLTGGLSRCGRCGAALVARPNERGGRRYVCAKEAGGCAGTYHVAETFEEFVREAVFLALDGPALAAVRSRSGGADEPADDVLADELRDTHGRIDSLAEAFAAGSVSLEAYQAATTKLESRRAELRDRLAAGTARRLVVDLPPGIAGLRTWWDGADLARRRELVALVVDRVTVGPAVIGRNRFDPGRVTIVWRA